MTDVPTANASRRCGAFSAVDDPDTQFYENYSCRSSHDYTGCNSKVDALIERRSAEIDPATRKQIVWQIERKLIADAVRPIIFFMRQGTCWQPEVKGLTPMDLTVSSTARGRRMARPVN